MAPIELSRLDIEGHRPEDHARAQLWRALRLEVDQLSMHGPFDLRRLMQLDSDARANWYAGRHEWLRAHFAGDPRVDVGA